MGQSSASVASLEFSWIAPGRLRPSARNVRRHSKKQILQLAEAIRTVGFLVPLVVDEGGTVLAGHARLAAANHLGLTAVPVVRAEALTEAQKRIFMLADNRIAENASWDRGQLLAELVELPAVLEPLGLDVMITGFEAAEILQLEADLGPAEESAEDLVPALPERAVTQRGDLWQLGPHWLLCGDAREESDTLQVAAGFKMRMTFTDPPYNVPIAGHVQGRGKVVHPEFSHAAGEMDGPAFSRFLHSALRNVATVSLDGAIAYVCMDWRHVEELITAARAASLTQLNLVVWNKTSPGQGSFYRSQHELIFVFRVGAAKPVNAFGMGKHGRTRSNVWTYPGGNSFHRGRAEEAAMHPTVKPIALVADALKDCSLRGDHVLDLFGGSGTTLMAAEKVGRIAHLVECEPAYVDVTIDRWQRHTKLEAVLASDHRTWTEVANGRRSRAPACEAQGSEAADRAASRSRPQLIRKA